MSDDYQDDSQGWYHQVELEQQQEKENKDGRA